jgi:DNA-binding transcriptional ArsR family regulator
MTAPPNLGGSADFTPQQQSPPGPPEQLLAANRQHRILRLLAEQDYITIGEVRRATGSSMATVNRDLAALARAGALLRIRGGATRTIPDTNVHADNLCEEFKRLRHVLDGGDVAQIEAALQQAMRACKRARAIGLTPRKAPIGRDSRLWAR